MPWWGGYLIEARSLHGGPCLGEFSCGNRMAWQANRGLTPEASRRPGCLVPPLPSNYSGHLTVVRPKRFVSWKAVEDSYLVDSASSHMLVSKIKPCMSKYKQLYGETANGSLNQLSFI